jgi:hypothetical protein
MNDILDKIKESDIVITVNSKDGRLLASQTVIYAKNGSTLRQIGLIQSLELKASVDKFDTIISIEIPSEIPGMSENLKKSLKETSSLMAEKGCSLKSIDIKPTMICAESVKICEKS